MSSFVYFFLMFWGAIFGGVPLSLIISGTINIVEMPFILFFVIIGVVVFTIGLANLIKCIKFRTIKRLGTKSIGVYIDSASPVRMNGTSMYYIKFSFVNDEGQSIEVKTPSMYTIRQVEFYEKLGRFEVKYKNKTAVITQTIDYRMLDKMLEKEAKKDGLPDYYEPTNERPEVKQGYYFCDYCGNEQEKPGKCKSCGAKVTSKNFRQR